MTSNLKIAKDAVRIAMKELRHGNKQAARAWAHRAVEIDPELEDGWLILAYLAEPRASLEYIKYALAVNPDSPAARQALAEVQRRLEKVSSVAPAPAAHPPKPAPEEPLLPQPSLGPKPEEPSPLEPAPEEPPLPQPSLGPPPEELSPLEPAPEKPARPSWTDWLRKLLVYSLACAAIGVLTLLVFQSRLGSANSLPPVRQEAIILLPLNTATASVTSMPIHSATATALPTNTATATALPTNTASATALPTEPATSTPAPTETASPSPEAADPLEAMPATNSPTQPAPERTSGEKRIVVQISEQHLYAYQGDTLMHDFVISTGAEHATRVGSFSVLDKLPEAWSDPWSFWMPDWLGIYWVGNIENGIHALPVLPDGNVLWGDDLGTPVSHGCVVLNPEDARSLYDWTDIGTQVEILP